MSANNYHFIDHWRVKGSIEEVSQIITEVGQFSRWWPSVYLKMNVKTRSETGEPLDSDAVVKGWLPYTLHLLFHVTEGRPPYGFSLDVSGDFDGHGIWTFEQDGEWVNISYDWKIRADKPLLRYGSFLLKPLFASNHHWCMRKGEESLRLELARRHAQSDQDRAAIPAPPGPIRLFYIGS